MMRRMSAWLTLMALMAVSTLAACAGTAVVPCTVSVGGNSSSDLRAAARAAEVCEQRQREALADQQRAEAGRRFGSTRAAQTVQAAEAALVTPTSLPSATPTPVPSPTASPTVTPQPRVQVIVPTVVVVVTVWPAAVTAQGLPHRPDQPNAPVMQMPTPISWVGLVLMFIGAIGVVIFVGLLGRWFARRRVEGRRIANGNE